jgi:hypothetical protein
MEGNPKHNKKYPGHVSDAQILSQHHGTDDGRGRRQQRPIAGEARAWQAGHRELIAEIG